MKKLILGFMIALTTLTACNSGNRPMQHGHAENEKWMLSDDEEDTLRKQASEFDSLRGALAFAVRFKAATKYVFPDTAGLSDIYQDTSCLQWKNVFLNNARHPRLWMAIRDDSTKSKSNIYAYMFNQNMMRIYLKDDSTAGKISYTWKFFDFTDHSATEACIIAKNYKCVKDSTGHHQYALDNTLPTVDTYKKLLSALTDAKAQIKKSIAEAKS